MLVLSRKALRASIVLVLASPLIATTRAAYEQRDRAFEEMKRFAQEGPSAPFVAALRRTA